MLRNVDLIDHLTFSSFLLLPLPLSLSVVLARRLSFPISFSSNLRSSFFKLHFQTFSEYFYKPTFDEYSIEITWISGFALMDETLVEMTSVTLKRCSYVIVDEHVSRADVPICQATQDSGYVGLLHECWRAYVGIRSLRFWLAQRYDNNNLIHLPVHSRPKCGKKFTWKKNLVQHQSKVRHQKFFKPSF